MSCGSAPRQAAITREIRAVNAAAQRAGSEALAPELRMSFAMERFRETGPPPRRASA
ncbi:MAG TPA: hypothetical protein VK824_05795 [Planctomycetota bacterium]|nr:hypothetical protein [Planctomycetota bacterium]